MSNIAAILSDFESLDSGQDWMIRPSASERIIMLDQKRMNRISTFHDMELEKLQKAHESGVIIAVPAALHYCHEHDRVPPPWLIQAALDLLCDLLRREKSTKRGRSAGAVARYRQDMIDFVRWNEVTVLEENQQRSMELMSTYPTCPSPLEADIYTQEGAKAEWLGTSRSRLYHCVSEVLEKTDAFGSPESIKRSYLQVQRNERDPAKAFRYYLLPYPFLSKLGIEGDLGYGRHAKIQAWRTSPLCTYKRPARKRAT
jgi:hypothetical protein